MLAVDPAEITLGETGIINSIEQVGLSHAISPANAHNPFMEGKAGIPVVLELKQTYVIQS